MYADESAEFPGFEAVQRLYKGQRSTVYRARRAADARPVVLKVANLAHTGLDEALVRLRRELALLTSIRSDRVIHAFDVATVGNFAVLIEDDVGAESLDRYLARGRFSLAEALELALGVADALRDVHAAGIIHMDVAPHNIVYQAATAQTRLIDFDVATAWRTDHHGFVAPGKLEGTLRYMAPEQTGRMNRATDSRADLYALGVTLFELLTGQLPFAETDALSIVHAHLAVRPPAPETIDRAIPDAVSAIAMKLLAKPPEERYQTAEGVAADLRICLAQLAGGGSIEAFPLGRQDATRHFALPTKLYGRAAELSALAEVLARVSEGAVEAVLVSGASGVGKTSVVRELFPQLTQARGYFLSGKFDQLRGDTPYPALVAAFDDLVDHLLTESEDELARWRSEIAAAIAPNGQVVIDAIPALERIIGPQPAVLGLDAAGTQNRFRLTLQKFMQVFTRRSHPLVLFLDDMQWADHESIQLLLLLAMSEGTEAFLLIEAFRDNELSQAHAVMVAARELGKHRRVTRVPIAQLPASEIAALVADTLHRDAASIEPLARLVCRKTDGNPFFVRQLLLALHETGHIEFDAASRQFTFDAASIERVPISDNVADLLADNLRKLSEATQRVLALAAAIGNRFEIDMLALVAETTPVAVHEQLQPAFEQELVVPLSKLEYIAAAGQSGLVVRSFRFQHDRIQRAAYASIQPEEQLRMHLRIGELLLAGATPAEVDDQIFDVVSHWNRAASLVRDRARLAALNLQAARKARGSAAHAVAVECLQVAIAQLDWQADYQAELDAHIMLAECMYHGGHVAQALCVLDDAAAHATRDHDRGTIETLRAMFHSHANDLEASIADLRRAAVLLGHALPDQPDEVGRAIGAAFAAIFERIGGREIEALIDLPAMTDTRSLALIELFRSCGSSAFQVEPMLGVLLMAQIVLLSLDHGNSASSPHGYIGFGQSLLRTDMTHLAFRFGKLGLDLSRRSGDRALQPSLEFLFGAFSSPWDEPLPLAIACLQRATRSARDIGDYLNAGNAAIFEIEFRVWRAAEPLSEIDHDARVYRQQCQEIGDVGSARLLSWQIERVRVLMAELPMPPSEEIQRRVAAMQQEAPVLRFHFLASLIDIVASDGDDAAAEGLAGLTRQLEHSMPNNLIVEENRFRHSLVAVAVCRQQPARIAELAPVIEANQALLARWSTRCPANFEAMYLLVEAERASLSGDLEATLARFDQAIASAVRHGWRRLEALAHELHGRFWLQRGKPDFAASCLQRARSLYAFLSMQRKVSQIDRLHPGLARGGSLRLDGTATTTSAAEVLDVTAIAKATRAISGELELGKLLERLLDIIFENAGAEGGALVLDAARGLSVAASRSGGTQQVSTTGVPLAVAALPRSLIQYVRRTEAVVVIDDATADARFGKDDYIRAHKPQSVLCMPVKHKDRTLGVLYLENTLISRAFTQARLEALTILVSQIAVSLENATLFAAQRVHVEAISRANEELRNEIAVREQAERELARYRDRLEDLIAERTKELTVANQKLRDAAVERERIEAELRLAQKLESVGRLAAGVAHEINTPVQFVSDNLTFVRDAFPGLVGVIDKYQALARITRDQGDIAAAIAAADAAAVVEDEVDLAYLLSHTPGALAGALDGVGRVAAIVRSMKDFAHPDRDEKTMVDLNRAIESTLVIAANEYKYVAELHTNLAELPLVRCNAGEINQVVLNLVINAAHAIRDVVNGTRTKGVIGVRTRVDDDEVEIAISDTGTGIPVLIRDKIYDPFFTTKEVGHGTGQGLAIARSVIVEKHGGSLRFETETGAGTTFFIRIPLGEAA